MDVAITQREGQVFATSDVIFSQRGNGRASIPKNSCVEVGTQFLTRRRRLPDEIPATQAVWFDAKFLKTHRQCR
jgi:hypothetical protein